MELSLSIRKFDKEDIPEVSSWVASAQDLRFISEDRGPKLDAAILDKWCSSSIEAFVFSRADKPVGFCTLSCSETNLPNEYVELCHLIVSPTYRRKYFGTTLVYLMRILAGMHEYRYLLSRIVPDNHVALSFAAYVRWIETCKKTSFLDPAFRWFEYELKY